MPGRVNETSSGPVETAARELNVKQREADVLRAQLEELRRELRGVERLFDERENEVLRLRARLAEMTQSRGWRLVEGLRRIRRWLLPAGSGRERVACFMVQKARRVVHYGRQGPRALADAILAAVSRRRHGPRPSPVAALPPVRSGGPRQTPRIEPAADPGTGVPGLVTVVLPVYNQAALLPVAVESVLKQTYANLELIIVDDGSTDAVETVLRRYVDDPKVRILTQRNQRLPNALSNGFAFATGEFWTWTSADNLMGPTQLQREAEYLRRYPDVAMVYANYLAIDERGEPLRDPSFRPQNRPVPESPAIHLPHETERLNMVADNFIGPCFVYRDWAGRLVGEYTPEMGFEDYDYWMRMNALTRIAHLDADECLYQYRVHDNTLTARAGELRIYEGVQGLVARERARQALYGQPWTVFADAPTRQWLSATDTTGDTVLPLERLGAGPTAGGKRLVLIHASSLAGLRPPPGARIACVAAWFDGDRSSVYRQRGELRSMVDVCFAADRAGAARLALFHEAAFVAPVGQGLYDLAVAFGNSRGAYDAGAASRAVTRTLPEPFDARGGRRVLLQVDKFLEGGLEHVVLDLAETLREEGIEPVLLVLGERGAAVERARERGLSVLSLRASKSEEAYRELLREHRIDLANGHFSVYGIAAARELEIPFVQTIHTAYVGLWPAQIAALQGADAATTAYICTSGNTALYADLRLGLDVGKMLIAPNGIDVSRLALRDRKEARARLRQQLGLAADDFAFLNVGSIYRDKGQRLAVAALAEVRREHPRAKLVLVGKVMEEEYLTEIKEEIEGRGLGDAVVFADHSGEVAAFYALADAFVLPSFWEGWSLALAEALYMGLPIVATDVGAARDVLPKVGAQVVPAPYDTIADVDLDNIGRYVRRDQPELVVNLAAAMKRVCADASPPALSDAQRQALDRRQAYRAYVRLFRWLWQGGSPAAARAWLRGN